MFTIFPNLETPLISNTGNGSLWHTIKIKYCLSTEVYCLKELLTVWGTDHNITLCVYNRLPKDFVQCDPNFSNLKKSIYKYFNTKNIPTD